MYRDRNIKNIFEEHCSHIKFDRKLLDKLQRYERDFVHKTEDHIKFFGGNLMGHEVVRFTPSDRSRWFDEILEADEGGLRIEIHALPDVEAHRHVSSDVMNISTFWMVHKFLEAPRLSQSEREQGALLCMLILNYKYITSILAHWFKYKADPVVAQATYDALTKRFKLKVVGTWGALLEDRSQDIIRRGGLHERTLRYFDNDRAIVEMVNNTQGMIKSTLKYIRDVFSRVQGDERALVKTITGTIDLDGDVKVRDRQKNTSKYIEYIETTIPDRNSFIVPELVTVISSVITTAPKNQIEDMLDYCTENFSVKADKDLTRLPAIIMEHAFDYLTKNPGVMSSGRDITGLLSKMRSVYQASKANDPLILEARKIGESVAAKATRSKNRILLSALRNALMLYILLRAFTMDHYRNL